MSPSPATEARVKALIASYADDAPMDVDPRAMARLAAEASARKPGGLARLSHAVRQARGRFDVMNTTHKAGAALAAVILVVGGAAVIGRMSTVANVGPTPSAAPSAGPTAAPTNRAAVAPQAPAEFTGIWRCGPPLRSGTTATFDVGGGTVLTRTRDGAWSQSLDTSDPRLDGTIIYHTYETDEYRTEGADDGPSVWAATHRIENADGAWEASGIGATFPGATEFELIPTPLIGEGAYEGLVAIYEMTLIPGGCDANIRGYIFAGAPLPEPYVP